MWGKRSDACAAFACRQGQGGRSSGDVPVPLFRPPLVLSLLSCKKTTIGQRSWYRHADDVGLWKGDNPFAVKRHGSFKLPRADNQATRYLTRREARDLLAALKPRSQQVHDMALLSLRTGLRATELFGIQGQDLDLEGNIIHIRAKGGEPQSVPAPPDIMSCLIVRRSMSNYLMADPFRQKYSLSLQETTWLSSQRI